VPDIWNYSAMSTSVVTIFLEHIFSNSIQRAEQNSFIKLLSE